MTRQLQDAYLVAATRSAVGRAPRGALRNTRPDTLLAHVLKSVVASVPALDPKRIDDAIVGCALRATPVSGSVDQIAVARSPTIHQMAAAASTTTTIAAPVDHRMRGSSAFVDECGGSAAVASGRATGATRRYPRFGIVWM